MGDSARVCQFFLRGRCQRLKCEFRHPADLDKEKEKRPNGTDRPSTAAYRETCKFFMSTGCKFGANCHFKHVGRERRRSRSRSKERKYRSESEDERKADSSDDEQEKKKERRRRDEKDKESQRRKLRMEEKNRDLKRRDSKPSLRERTEKCPVIKKHGSTKILGNRTRSKSPQKKDKSDTKVVKLAPTNSSSQEPNCKSLPHKPSTSPPSSSNPDPDNRCSKCGQKVAKRRATS